MRFNPSEDNRVGLMHHETPFGLPISPETWDISQFVLPVTTIRPLFVPCNINVDRDFGFWVIFSGADSY